MKRVAPHVEGSDAQSARHDFALPRFACRGIAEEARHVAVPGRCVSAGANLQVGDERGLLNEPVHHIDEGSIRECLRHQTDVWSFVWLRQVDAILIASRMRWHYRRPAIVEPNT